MANVFVIVMSSEHWMKFATKMPANVYAKKALAVHDAIRYVHDALSSRTYMSIECEVSGSFQNNAINLLLPGYVQYKLLLRSGNV